MASRPNLVAEITGKEGAGKSHFWLTAPQPIAVISTDTNTDATARAYFQLDDDEEFDPDVLRLLQINMPMLEFDERDDVKDESEEKWDSVREFLRPMLKDEDEKPGTLVLDTATDVYDLKVLSVLGKKDQIPPEVRRNMIGRCNTGYKGIIQAAKDVGIHVLLVHRAKELWVDKEVRTQRGLEDQRVRLTGPFDVERAGFKDTGFITSVGLHVAFDPEREGKLRSKFGMRIVRCNQRPGLIGKEYWGSAKVGEERVHQVSFPYLMTQLYPKTTIEDWRA